MSGENLERVIILETINKRGRGTKKAPVIGAVERGGRVSAKAVKKDKMKGKNLRAFVKETVDTTNSHLMTDEYKGYLGMSKIVPHSVIKHQKWYVDGICSYEYD